MDFYEFKKAAMKGYDDAKKEGLVDEDIIKCIDEFNKLNNYYTTSSCSGRILLVKNEEGVNKAPDSFYYKSHGQVKFSEVMKKINAYEGSEVLWLKAQSFILHVGCKELDDAKKLLDYCHLKGIKRAGITSFNKRIIVEIIGTQSLITLLVKDKKLLATEDYIKELVKESNSKLAKTKEVLYSFFNDSKKNLY